MDKQEKRVLPKELAEKLLGKFDEISKKDKFKSAKQEYKDEIMQAMVDSFVDDVFNLEQNKDVTTEAFEEIIDNVFAERIELALDRAIKQEEYDSFIPEALEKKGYKEVYSNEFGRIFASIRTGQILKYDKGDSIEKFFYSETFKNIINKYTSGKSLEPNINSTMPEKLDSIARKAGYKSFLSKFEQIDPKGLIKAETLWAYAILDSVNEYGESTVLRIMTLSRISGKQGKDIPVTISSFSLDFEEALAIKKAFVEMDAEVEKGRVN